MGLQKINKNGQILIAVLFTITLFGVIGSSLLFHSRSAIKDSTIKDDVRQAAAIARSGMDMATAFTDDPLFAAQLPVFDQSYNISGGSVNINIDCNQSDCLVRSTGMFNEIYRLDEIVIEADEDDQPPDHYFTPIVLLPLNNTKSISGSCYLTTDGNVHCQNGLGMYTDKFNYLGGDAVSISAGDEMLCILKSDGTFQCAKDGGGGNMIVRVVNDDNYIDIWTGWGSYCGLTSSHNVKCSTTFSDSWMVLSDYMGGDAVSLSRGTPMSMHYCAVVNTGQVKCWGNCARSYCPNYSEKNAIMVAVDHNLTCILKNDGNYSCYGIGSWGTADYLGGDAVRIAVGDDSVCFLDTEGVVHCEYKDSRETALFDYTNIITDVAEDISLGYEFPEFTAGNVLCILTSNDLHCVHRSGSAGRSLHLLEDAPIVIPGPVIIP